MTTTIPFCLGCGAALPHLKTEEIATEGAEVQTCPNCHSEIASAMDYASGTFDEQDAENLLEVLGAL